MKGLTMVLAVSTMAINMALEGIPDSVGIIVSFLFLTMLNLAVGIVLLHSVREHPFHDSRSTSNESRITSIE